MTIYILLIVSVLFSCKDEENNLVTAPAIDQQVYYNAEIYTVNSSLDWKEAMLIENGLIKAVGTSSEIRAMASSDAEQYNMRGRMIMPGIHDVHQHPLEAGSDNFQFVLSENTVNPENYAPEIRNAVNQNANATWILGWGFDIHVLLDGTREPIQILDDISITRPIAVMELTSHSIWVNSKALELANIDSSTMNPAGGIIMKDQAGKPNGLLIDKAGNIIIDLAISSIPNSEQNDYNGLVNYSLPLLAENGITSICDARTYWKRNHHETWKRVEAANELTVRVNLGLWAYSNEGDQFQINKLKSLYENDSNSFLKINQIKLYSDGIIINTTSAMQSSYKLDLFGMPNNNGLNYFTQARIESYITALESTGFDFHIHTIGDRGVKEALNAIEQSGTRVGRHRLTHVEFVDPSDYPRFAQLNVTADCQVAGDFSNPAHWSENNEYIDASLTTAVIPIKSLSNAGARICLSSDWDVSSLNPFVGIQNAVTRSPQEITLEEAIKAYTINSAYVMRQENKVGSIEVGKEADFIVLSQNIFNIASDQISQTKVQETYLQGELIFP